VSPHPTGHSADEVRGLFTKIARRYDFLNRALSAGLDLRWRAILAGMLAPVAPRLVLDVCAGTGDTALEIARPARGLASVAAVDFSEPMVALAARKVARAGVEARVLPVVGDCLCLPFADATFDAAVVTFGVRNLEDPGAGLRELHRVLRQGGLLGILDFFRPGGDAVAWVGAVYRRYLVPPLAIALGGDRYAYGYLPRTVDMFDSTEEFERRLAQSGFAVEARRRLTLHVATAIVARKA
jgi:demethylmenaquinone methyltransferase/2-methoxy-6-polyprenyl-1,4-benzoquinol methylase